MFRSLTRKAYRNRGSILVIMLGQGVRMVGLAVGTRLLTEAASASTFGLAKLCIGVIDLLRSVFVRPYNHFAMREYHDAIQHGVSREFESHARRSLLLLSVLTAGLLVAGFLVYRQVRGVPTALTALACGFLLVGETNLNHQRAMAMTGARHAAVSIIDACRFWGTPLAAAGALFLVADSATVLLGAQAIVYWVIAIAAYRVALHRTPEDSGPPAGEAASRTVFTGSWNRNAWRFAVPLMGLGVFQWLATIGDRYILAGYLPLDSVGRYTAAYGLIAAPMLALGEMSTRFLSPLIFRAAAQDQTTRRYRLRLGAVLVSTAVSLAALATIVLAGDLIASLLLAEDYRAGARELMIWFTAAQGFLVVSFAFELDALATKRTGRLTLCYAFAAAVKIGLSFALIPYAGAVGAAQATCVGFAVYVFAIAVLTIRESSRSAASG